jgi:hypothetical protein
VAVTVEDVREFLRDHAETNRLTDEVDFTVEQITRARNFVVADFNSTPVFTSYPPDIFPFINILLYGISSWLLTGLAVQQTRNHLPYSTSGGVQVDDQNKGPQYSQLADRFQAMYEKKTREAKNQINLDQGWSNVSSEYLTNRSW